MAGHGVVKPVVGCVEAFCQATGEDKSREMQRTTKLEKKSMTNKQADCFPLFIYQLELRFNIRKVVSC